MWLLLLLVLLLLLLLRCCAAGHAGARNCKFLEQIEVTDNPCKGNCNWKQYAVHAPDVPMIKIANFEDHHEELMMDPVSESDRRAPAISLEQRSFSDLQGC